MIVGLLALLTNSLFANEVNIFSARHYDSDVQLYDKFTAKTGIQVNVVSGKDKALLKRITEKERNVRRERYVDSKMKSVKRVYNVENNVFM